jgi:hypothetical protein
MGDVRLVAPRVRVVRDGQDDLEVQADNRDLILWDRTRIRHKWPKFDEAPFLWLTFLSWSAARRSGAIPAELTYERWEAEVLDVTSVDDDDTTVGDDDLGRPTQAGHEPA